MSRRRRRHTDPETFRSERDLFTQPTRSLPTVLRTSALPFDLTLIEDRREYHPEGFYRPARNLSGTPHDPVVPSRKNKARPFVARGLQFSAPRQVTLCVRRKIRKEVLFAKKKTRAGARSRRRRRNWYSLIGC